LPGDRSPPAASQLRGEPAQNQQNDRIEGT